MILKPDKVASLPESYRPISLLPVIGKLMEKIMTQRIAELMIKKGLINKFQAGFQKGKSTTHQLLRLTEHIYKWFNKRPSGRTVSIFIDAEKAFDTVWHDGLRKMMFDAGLPVIIIRWLSKSKSMNSYQMNFYLKQGSPKEA